MNSPQNEPVTVIVSDNIVLQIDTNKNIQERLRERERAIETIWQRALQSKKELYNAPLCCLSQVEHTEMGVMLHVFFAEYKHYVAQVNGLALDLTPVGVSGVVIADSGSDPCYILAKRSMQVFHYPGALEFVPSGGIDESARITHGEVDPLPVLRKEFEEEVGLPWSTEDDVQLFAMVHDHQQGLIDLCYAIKTNYSATAVVSALSERQEYEYAIPLRAPELEQIVLAEDENAVVPTTRALAALMVERSENP